MNNSNTFSGFVKCAVFAVNANGEADICYVRVACTRDQYDMGDHYPAALKAASSRGYEVGEGTLAADENEPAGRAVLGLANWSQVPIEYI